MPQRIPVERVRWTHRLSGGTVIGDVVAGDSVGTTRPLPRFRLAALANLYVQVIGQFACGYLNATEYPVAFRFLKVTETEAKTLRPAAGTSAFIDRGTWSSWLTGGWDTTFMASITVGTGATFVPGSTGWCLIEMKMAATGSDGPTWYAGALEVYS